MHLCQCRTWSLLRRCTVKDLHGPPEASEDRVSSDGGSCAWQRLAYRTATSKRLPSPRVALQPHSQSCAPLHAVRNEPPIVTGVRLQGQ